MDIDESARGELLRRSLHRICRRTDGKFAAALHYGFGLWSDDFFQLSKDVPVSEGGVHSYDGVEDLQDDTQRFTRFMFYRNGRVAWFPEGYSMPYLAVVDDLRTRVRRVYQFPNHGGSTYGYKTALGNKLFIIGQGTILYVWHLELNRMESFTVPGNFKRCITQDETVIVVSQSSDLYLWRFGQRLQHIASGFFYAFHPVLESAASHSVISEQFLETWLVSTTLTLCSTNTDLMF
jgi:hypothetical protein